MKIGTGITFVAIMAVATVTTAVAQGSGADIYKARCQNCHGPDGMAGSGIGKVMKVKAVTDPELRKLSEEAMIQAVRNGSGKMQPYKSSLTDAQIKDSVDYFRKFIK